MSMKKEIKFYVGNPDETISVHDIVSMIAYAKDMLTDISVIDRHHITDFTIQRWDEDFFTIRFDYEGDEDDES